jgi:hypothetical protein
MPLIYSRKGHSSARNSSRRAKAKQVSSLPPGLKGAGRASPIYTLLH